ncbi:hypothetical protein ACA910_003642 [Epithemia clementina (nom. ined.)]
MLAGEEHRAALRKECDADALLENLMDSRGNIAQAITTATANIEQITSGAWTLAEWTRYNEGFRHHQGALRKMAETLAPLKTMQEVVDYHFCWTWSNYIWEQNLVPSEDILLRKFLSLTHR